MDKFQNILAWRGETFEAVCLARVKALLDKMVAGGSYVASSSFELAVCGGAAIASVFVSKPDADGVVVGQAVYKSPQGEVVRVVFSHNFA